MAETNEHRSPDAAGGRSRAGMDPVKRRRFIVIAVIVVLAVIVAAVLWRLHARNFASTDDAAIDAYVARVSPQTSGRVTQVLVHDDEPVRAGQTLVTLDTADLQARLAQARAQQAQAEAQLAQAEADVQVRAAAYRQAAASAGGARAQAVQADEDLARYVGLRAIDQAAVAGQQIDHARAAAASARAQLASSQNQAKSAVGQVTTARAQVKAAAAAVRTAQAQVAQAEVNLAYARVVAPEDGTVADRTVAVGDAVSPGSQMLAIVPWRIWVTANFKETQLSGIRPGEKADIKVDAFRRVHFWGHVVSIQRGAGAAFALLPPQNATGNYVKVVQRVPVIILIDGPRDRLAALGPGMSVVPTVRVR